MVEIKKLRQEKGLTQEKLAQLTGLTTATINKAENHGNIRLITYRTIIETLTNYDNSNTHHPTAA
jgi:transcriptional regulator with XRE-family HTH domain